MLQDILVSETVAVLSRYGLSADSYSLAICRIEPENNVHTILEAFSQMPNKNILFIGNWDKSAYGKEMRERYSAFPNIKIQSAVYDLRELNVLRSNCKFYIHGHSAGGTNPSLVEAMFFAKPIIAFDCIYNRESTENKADYFNSSDELIKLLDNTLSDFENNAKSMAEIAQRRYRWETIAKQYENLYK